MLDFLGVTEHFSCMENTPFSFPALFRDMAGEAVSLDGVIFSGSIVSANQEVVEISIEKGESSNEVIFSFPALPEGRWSYNVLVQADDGSQRILFSGYISVLGVSRVAQLAGGPPMKNRTLLVVMPGEATIRLRMEWMATTAAQAFAYHALQASKNAHADAETAGQAAKTATDAAATAAARAKEAEGYAGSAYASKTAAANSEAAAATSAANAARDAKNVHDDKTAMESLASEWPQTVSNGKQQIIEARNEAVTAIQDKQAAAVLAVGRASQTAQQNISGAQADAVSAVQAAGKEAQGTITPLVQRVETAKEAIDQAEGRINTAATNAANSATSAGNSATAAANALAAIPQVDASGNMTLAGGLTAAGTMNANGGVRVPEPSTAQEALSYNSMIREQAQVEWNLVRNGSYWAAKSERVKYCCRLQEFKGPGIRTSNVNINMPSGNIVRDLSGDALFTLTAASGISLGCINTPPWKFMEILGDHDLRRDFSTATTWNINVPDDDFSILIGSTSQPYSLSPINSPCYSHPIHWINWNRDNADYRYPLNNSVNGFSDKAGRPTFQITLYGQNYLGATTSRLIRGTDYGTAPGDERYVWAILPPLNFSKNTSLTVASTSRNPDDNTQILGYYELFVDGIYVMEMPAGFCGTGHTASVTVNVKAYDLKTRAQIISNMGGMQINKSQLSGSANPLDLMRSVVMEGVVAKPLPSITASSVEVPAAGGDVVLTVSSPLSEAVYVLNDTMCGHDPAAVWCTQSAEEMPAGGGQITLTLAANTTGQARQVWAFVGHHYAQAAVVKINQSA